MAICKLTGRSPLIKDISGQRFGRLTAISLAPDSKPTQWICVCQCGTTVIIRSCNLRSGASASCGCLHRDGLADRNSRHRMTASREYGTWRSAKRRCFSPNDTNYKHYGGRGITMCDEWKNSFEAFYAYVGDCPPGYSLDRINNDGNYEPGNVRWASSATQSLNQRSNILITHNGKTQTVAQWSEETGIAGATLRQREYRKRKAARLKK